MTPTAPGPAESVRLVHLSDVHVTVRPLGWSKRDWMGKRVTGWINLRWLGRARRFGLAEDVLAALFADLRQKPPDHVVFSGDATTLGFDSEFARAAELLGVAGPEPLPGIAVPGNHDYYTRSSVIGEYFERHFARWQDGLRIDGARYPFAQRVGPLWLIGVNSSTANRWAWDAAGLVGPAQLDRLARLLDQLEPGPRILVTHYPYCLPDGRAENRVRMLRDRKQLLAVAERGRIALWLHGHRHQPYRLLPPRYAPFPIICAGSATQVGFWSFGDYSIEGNQVRSIRRVFDPEKGLFQSGESFEVKLSS